MSERPDLVYLVGMTEAQIVELLNSAEEIALTYSGHAPATDAAREAIEILRRKLEAIRGGYSYPVRPPRKRA